MQNHSDNNTRWLWAIALTSLALNLITITLLIAARGLIGGSLARANQSLFDTLATLDNYQYDLAINLQDEIRLVQADEVLLDQQISVPISLTVPVLQELPVRQQINVPINQTIPIRQTVNAPLTIQGTTVNIPVPVELNVPINLIVPVDVDVSVPVEMEIAIREELEVPVRELIPLQNGAYEPLAVGLDMQTSVPVPVDDLLSETRILPMLEELHRVLNIIESLLLLPAPPASGPALAPAP